MTAETTVASAAWEVAVRRATAAADRELPGGIKDDCWDNVTIRDIIAAVLCALHVCDETPVGAVPWSKVLWWLWDDEEVITLVEDTFAGAGQAIAEPDGELEDPLLARWRWLNRTWDPQAPVRRRNVPPPPWDALRQRGHVTADGPLPQPRWDGMSRGIAEGLPDPAIVRNSSGVSGPPLSHQSGHVGIAHRHRHAPLGVSEVKVKSYAFETAWRLAA